MQSPTAPDEIKRLQSLRRYAILDTPPETAFDRIASLAARMLNAPIAAFTLVDENRQWFKACCGLDIRETSREVSFCAHTILAEDVFVVPDASEDRRFCENPLVTGAPHIRFYAGYPIKASDGSKIGALCVIDTKPREFGAEEKAILRDLGEIGANELQLRVEIRQRNELAVAIDRMSTGMVVSDPNQPDGPITYCNPAFTALTGYSPGEVMGRSCRFLQGPDTDLAVIAELRAAIKEGRPFKGTLLNYKKDGSTFWNDLTVTPIFNSDGRLIQFVGLQEDITARVRMEESLKEAYEQLRKVESQRAELTNMIAHDMRSPLGVTMGFLDVLRTSAIGRLDQEDIDAIAYASESAARINGMITSMLDLSRLESGEMPMTITECDLVGLVRKSLSDLLALKGKDRLKLALPTESIAIRCDAQLTARVLLNLASNALKFTSGEQDVRIVIARDSSQARVVVLDNGPGIAEEFHERIFEKFGQVGSTRKEHSTGLGLTFCKLAIEAQGGSIGVKSVVGIGSAFWFSFPQVRALGHAEPLMAPGPGRALASEFAADVEWGDERVLVGISERMA